MTRLGAAGQAVLLVAAFALSGALAGVVWERLWDAPRGVVVEGRWFLDPAGPDHAFSGTGWYVVVALLAGALTALVLGRALPRHEIASVLAIAVGSLVAAWVMYEVGHALGPEDPRVLAADQPDRTTLPSDLRLAGASAYTAFPIGALTASIYLYLASGRRAARRVDRRVDRRDDRRTGPRDGGSSKARETSGGSVG